MRKDWIVCDLDGTLCDISRRVRYARVDWEAFHRGIPEDKLIEPVAAVLHSFRGTHQIALCTGRPEKYRSMTVWWLREHEIPYDRLLMRNKGDYHSDPIVKPELLRNVNLGPDNVLFIMEDRDVMVKRWRELGYTCFHVAPGAF